jgi:hypothetical protein
MFNISCFCSVFSQQPNFIASRFLQSLNQAFKFESWNRLLQKGTKYYPAHEGKTLHSNIVYIHICTDKYCENWSYTVKNEKFGRDPVTNSFLTYDKIFPHFLIYKEAPPQIRMTMHPIPSKFPNTRTFRKFSSFFLSTVYALFFN